MKHLEVTLILPAQKSADEMDEILDFAMDMADLDASGIDIAFCTTPTTTYKSNVTKSNIGDVLKNWPSGEKQNHLVAALDVCLKKYTKRYALNHKSEVFVIYDDHTNMLECEEIISLLSKYVDNITEGSLSLVVVRVAEPGKYSDSLEAILEGKIPSKISFHHHILGGEEDNDKIISSIKEQTAIAV